MEYQKSAERIADFLVDWIAANSEGNEISLSALMHDSDDETLRRAVIVYRAQRNAYREALNRGPLNS